MISELFQKGTWWVIWEDAVEIEIGTTQLIIFYSLLIKESHRGNSTGRNLISLLGWGNWARNWNDPVKNFIVQCTSRKPIKWIATESRNITHRGTFHASLQAPSCIDQPREWHRRVDLLRGSSATSSARAVPRLSGGTCTRQADDPWPPSSFLPPPSPSLWYYSIPSLS